MRRPPWRTSGCAPAHAVRVERLAAFVDSTGSFQRGERGAAGRLGRRGQVLASSLEHGLQRVGRVALRSAAAASGLDVPLGDRPGPLPRGRHRSGGRPLPGARRRPLGLAARPAAAAHRARRLAVPDLAGLQRLRRRPERDPGQLVPVLAPAARLAEGPAPARRGRGRPQGRARRSRAGSARAPVRTQQITDVELGRLPLSTLRKYQAIVFPGHSEYYEPATYDLLKRYRDERRQPRLPAGEPVLPPGAARSGARTRW